MRGDIEFIVEMFFKLCDFFVQDLATIIISLPTVNPAEKFFCLHGKIKKLYYFHSFKPLKQKGRGFSR